MNRVPDKLEDLPNIGRKIAADLRRIGIHTPGDLRGKDLLQVYRSLETVMGPRHDPCVYYTLLSVGHYFAEGRSVPWWKFTAEGKKHLQPMIP